MWVILVKEFGVATGLFSKPKNIFMNQGVYGSKEEAEKQAEKICKMLYYQAKTYVREIVI